VKRDREVDPPSYFRNQVSDLDEATGRGRWPTVGLPSSRSIPGEESSVDGSFSGGDVNC
jgi:hypothetical protein